uniref:sensor histidine kinase n=1 Tax=Fulvivirga sp. TaxID=1931237 RepID=UPI00404A8F12
MRNQMWLYEAISKFPLTKKSFSLKVLLVAFIGIHIPLFGIIGFVLFVDTTEIPKWNVALFTLVFTLFSTGITLLILNNLLKPVLIAKDALLRFKDYSKLPNLPLQFNDEAGILMREVQQTIETLMRIESERENVLHLLQHDLQGPINDSISVLELAKRNSLDNDVISILEDSFRAQRNRLLKSIDYIKSQKNLAAQKDVLVSVSLEQLVNDALQSVKIVAKRKKVGFELEIIQKEPYLLPKIILDRILTNLLDNAIKHSPENEKIQIKTNVNDKILIIQIKDFGTGIPDDVMPSLFELAKGGLDNYDSENPSMGIGLNLCQKLIQSIGGRIVATNNDSGHGATFIVEYLLADKT